MRSAMTAPCHVIAQRSPGQFGSSSTVQPDSAQSLEFGGGGLIDHRMPYAKLNAAGFGVGAIAVGWNSGNEVLVMDATPVAASTTNIAPSNNATSGTPLPLVTVSGGGVSVLAAPYTTLPFASVFPTGSVVMGSATGVSGLVPAGAPGYQFVGLRDVTAYYDPTTALTYVIQITGSVSGTGGAFIVRGFDFYGQPMAETITVGAGAVSQAGLKAWKCVTSVTPQFTDAHGYSVGTTLNVGLHIAVDYAGYFFPYNNTTGWVTNPTIVPSLGSTTINTASTATSADVRGTFVPTAVRTLLYVTTSTRRTANPASLGGMSVGLFGVTQFTQ